MKYLVSMPDPSSKYIDIEMEVENVSEDKICFQLPAWRPGRYELGNFAKNIQKWNAFDENGKALKFKKITKDKWEVETAKKGAGAKIIVRYNYFASQYDAGGCWLDKEQLYVNPIHCFLYVEERKNETCTIELKIPANWKIASSLEKGNKHSLIALNYDQLVDSPFIASPSLKHHAYKSNGINFHLWFQGECKPDLNRIEKDFKNFTDIQIKTMGDFPSGEYHFLIQVLPYNFYHGVEHSDSTVLAIGPGYELMSSRIYPEFIGLASHELFHTWNVKAIRPVEMSPYDYTKENYSQLGYIYEGFTTYYGDLLLARAGFFSFENYLRELSAQLQKHLDNFGRYNHSVVQSSFDTWLDGYVHGVPDKKVSIYTEGSLIALMLDFSIRKFTDGKKSLDDVMRKLYVDFGKRNIGYSEKDIQKIVEEIAQHSFADFFENYVYKAASFDTMLEEILSFGGLEIKRTASPKSYERFFGFRMEVRNGINKVLSIAPLSPAAVSGLAIDDEIISVNNIKVENNLNELFMYFENDEIVLNVFSSKKLMAFKLKSSGTTFYDRYEIFLTKKRASSQNEFLKAWCGWAV